MSILDRIRANQRNAQLSTGPKTEEGKAKVSQNRRTHGLNKLRSVMAYLLSDVLFEASAGFMQQFRRHAEVNLGVPDADVTQVNGELRQQLLNIGSLPVP